MTDREQLSVSQLTSLRQCGRAFEIERVEGRLSRPAYWTVRGNAVHYSIEAWENSARDIDICEYLQEVAWPRALEETLANYPDASGWIRTPRKTLEWDRETRFNEALNQVRRYSERAILEQDDWRVLESEVPFEIFPEGEEFSIRGYIDQVIEDRDGDISIRDFKTSSNDDKENDIQLATYRHGLIEARGWDVQLGVIWYTKLDRSSAPIDLSRFGWDYILMEYKKLYLIKQQGLYMANPSKKNCFFCGVKEFCLEAK